MPRVSLDGGWQISYFPEDKLTLNHRDELQQELEGGFA